MNIQLLNGADGKPAFVVLPVDEFNSLAKGRAEIDEAGEVWASIPVEAGEMDNNPAAALPHEIVEIIIEQNTSPAAAWRIYRNLTQSQAAELAGITQAALSQIEKQGSRPQAKTREMLARVYNCNPEQLAGL